MIMIIMVKIYISLHVRRMEEANAYRYILIGILKQKAKRSVTIIIISQTATPTGKL